MATVTGSKLAFFAQGNVTGSNVNLVLTTDGTNVPAPDPNKFNIEVFTVSPAAGKAAGYDASAFIQDAVSINSNTVQAGAIGSTEELLDGSFTLVDSTGFETINIVGSGGGGSNDTVVGGFADTIIGSAVASNTQQIDAGASHESIKGGAGLTSILAGAFDTVVGGAGSVTVTGRASGHLSITGGAGGLTAFDLGQNNVVTGTGGTVFIDDSYAGGGNSKLTAGGGAINFVKGNTGDVLIGGVGGGTTTAVLDASLGSQTVFGGQGSVTFINSANDVVLAGAAVAVFIASTGGDTIVGSTKSNFVGTSKTDVYLSGANDSIVGGSGDLDVAGSRAASLTVRGGSGALNAFNMGTASSVVGSTSGTTFINDSFFSVSGGVKTFTGGSSTLVGGVAATTVVAGPNDSIVGSSGTLEARIRSDLGTAETVNLSLSNAVSTIKDISVAGGTGGNASVTGFNTAIDKIQTSDTQAALQATETHDGTGNVILHFSDGTSMTIAGVTDANQITFIP